MKARTVTIALGAAMLLPGVAVAAGLSPSSPGLGAATAPVTSCGAVALEATDPWGVDRPTGTITSVKVAVPAACSGATVVVSVRNPSNTLVVASGSSTACSLTVCTVTLAPPAGTGAAGVDNVGAVHLALVGP